MLYNFCNKKIVNAYEIIYLLILVLASLCNNNPSTSYMKYFDYYYREQLAAWIHEAKCHQKNKTKPFDKMSPMNSEI